MAVLVGANSAATTHCASTATLLDVLQVVPLDATAAFASGATAENVSASLPSFSIFWFSGELTWFCHNSGEKNSVAASAFTFRIRWSKYSAISRFPLASIAIP